jgi:hypothetical protein
MTKTSDKHAVLKTLVYMQGVERLAALWVFEDTFGLPFSTFDCFSQQEYVFAMTRCGAVPLSFMTSETSRLGYYGYAPEPKRGRNRHKKID